MYPLNLTDPEFLQRSENYWFYGIVLSCMCYGLNFSLALSCMRLLLPQLRCYVEKHGPPSAVNSSSKSRDFYSFVFAFFLFGFATASIIPVVIVGKDAYGGIRNSSRGPAEYLMEHVFLNVTTLRVAYVLSIVSHIFTSIRLIRICFILQKYSVAGFFCRRGALWHGMTMSLPLSMFLASIASGIIFVIQVLAPSHLPHYLASKNWVLIWGAIATALSWECTGMISTCLLIYRHSLLRSLGQHLQVRYTGIVTMLLQCTLLSSAFSIFFMVAYSVKSPSLVMVPFLLTQVQVTPPLLALYRVTSNRTLLKDLTLSETSMLTFANRSTTSEDSREPQT